MRTTGSADSWRTRYDSLQLFTPSWAVKLPGWRFPKKSAPYPSREQMADYLEAYARRFDLPVRTGVDVQRISRVGDRYVLSLADGRIEADHVIVASGADRNPRIPAFSRELDPAIVQMHSSDYRNPSQLREGGVLVVGAGNSGADISLDVVGSHPTWLSGPDRGHVPVSIDTWVAQNVAFRIIRFVGLHVLTLRTPIGRRAKVKEASKGDMLVRVKPKQLVAAGIERVGKTVGVSGGLPMLEDGRVLDVANVIWCTGLPSRPVVDRPPDLRRGRRAPARARRRDVRARSVLRRPVLPVLRGVERDPGRPAGREVRRRAAGRTRPQRAAPRRRVAA